MIAVVMALIATFAAIASFNASSSEFTASACSRTLDQAVHFELGRRQSYADRYYEHARWQADNDLHRALARSVPGPTTLNDADAQIEYTLARLNKPVEEYTDPALDRNREINSALTKLAQQDVHDLGIRNHCANSESLQVTYRSPNESGADDGDYLQPLRDEAAAFRARVIGDDRAAFVLLIALAVFAFADIVPSAPPPDGARPVVDTWRRRRAFADVVGIVVATAAVVYTIGWLDRSLWFYFAGFAAAVLGLCVLLAALGHRRKKIHMWTATSTARMLRFMRIRGATDPSVELDTPVTQRPTERGEPAGKGEPDEHDLRFEGPSERISELVKHGHISGWFKRSLLVLIALTAVLAAFSEDAHGRDTTTADEAGERAVSEQIKLLHAGPPSELAAFDTIHGMVLAREARMRATAFATIRNAATARADTAAWEREAHRWGTVMGHLESARLDSREAFAGKTLGILLDSTDGPYTDPSFPRRFFVRGTTSGPAEQLALWDARDAERAAYEHRASVALGTITLFGIALYLFGQSLGMGQSQGGFVLAFFGISVLAMATFFGLRGINVVLSNDTTEPALPNWTCLTDSASGKAAPGRAQPDTRATAAARCFALAELRGQLAQTAQDYLEALDLFKRATTQRPGFALADFGAARITAALWSPQKKTRHVSLVDIEKLDELHDIDRQVESDLASRDLNAPLILLENLVLHDYLAAIINPSRPALEATIVRANDAIKMETDLNARALLRYRAAIALLADRRGDEAHDMYKAAFADLDPYATTLAATGTIDSNDLDAERRSEGVAGAAISDLELLRTRCNSLPWLASDCPELTAKDGTIDSLKSAIVCRTWRKRCTDIGRVSKHQLSVSWTIGGVAWRVPATESATRQLGHTVMLVYRRDPKLQTWYVLPELSYPVRPNEITSSKRWTRFIRSLHVGSGYTDCLQLDARYRVEIYSDGGLAGQAEFATPSTLPGTLFEATALRAPGVAMCYPGAWTFHASHDGRMQAGYRAHDGLQGAYGFGFLARRGLSRGAHIAEKRADVDRAVRMVLAKLLPQASLRLDRKTFGRCPVYFEDKVDYAEYAAGPFSVRAKVWDEDGGLISVAIVWERLPRRPSEDLSCLLLASMTKVDSDAPDDVERRALAAFRPWSDPQEQQP
ncbi:MAG TPA: hypothetical protein VGU66_04240 [Candidatus Elarobacter sp.]|nr:hypothetical protein [Candidatus Elarobacter sp.]